MSMRTPAFRSAQSPQESLASAAGASRHMVMARCLTRTRTRTPTPSEHLGATQWPAWLTACHHLTPHLQRLGDDCALLDLGPCSDGEAVAVVQSLITRLAHQQITLRAAIAPSGILAQLALIDLLQTPASAHEPLTILTPEQIADLLRSLPIAALARLQFADQATTTTRTLTQAASWLEEYGVRTLAHLTRLDDASLRRQFGARLGALLATIARGADPLPLQPTPAPLRLRFRLRLTAPITLDRLLLGLPPFCCEVASRLARRGLQGHTLELALRWEYGATGGATGETASAANSEPITSITSITSITRTLAQPIAGGRALTATLERMLATHFQTNSHTHAHADPQHPRAHDAYVAHDAIHNAIEDVHLTISDLLPHYPAQHAFWPQRARRLAATHELADVLARRHGKPLLLQSVLTAPDAIFEQDRSRLAPLHADMADVADVSEGLGHPARPAADVAEADADTDADPPTIPHGVHWW